MKGMIVAILVMLCCFAVLSGLNPTTGEFTADRSYLDKEYQVEVPTVLVVGGVLAALTFVFGTHKTGERNGHGGTAFDLETLLFVVLIFGALAKMTGMF